MKKPEIAADLIDYIDASILAEEYLPGARLPSMRSLCRKFSLSYNSAYRGIEYLCSQGKLVKIAKRGIFVNSEIFENSYLGAKKIGIIIVKRSDSDDYAPGIMYTSLAMIQRKALANNYELMIFPSPSDIIEPSLVNRINEQCSGVILLKEFDYMNEDFDINIPAVGVLIENDYNSKLSIVGIDPFNSAAKASKYFHEKQKDKVVIITDPRPAYYNRGKVFEFHWLRKYGEVLDFVVTKSTDSMDLDFSSEIGYFFTSDSLLNQFSLHYEKVHGVPLAVDNTVLGVDGKNMIMPWFHKFPTISVDWKVVGKMAFEECVARIEFPNRNARRIYIPGALRNV